MERTACTHLGYSSIPLDLSVGIAFPGNIGGAPSPSKNLLPPFRNLCHAVWNVLDRTG
jgi:hypothetical protein